ncbi:hypothetical protein [Mesobacillus maritimus]|uniref:hypothetical protein n=1 Tax=Mesobacillus maritimus TaxID=1643336 RepID=UPI00384C2C3C
MFILFTQALLLLVVILALLAFALYKQGIFVVNVSVQEGYFYKLLEVLALGMMASLFIWFLVEMLKLLLS